MDTAPPALAGQAAPAGAASPALGVLVVPSVTVVPGLSTSPAPDLDALLGVLTQLSRKHLLSFRIEVGRAVAEALFGGDPRAFHDLAWNKEGSPRRFAAARREALADLGLSEATLRQCVRAYFVARELPAGTIGDRFRALIEQHQPRWRVLRYEPNRAPAAQEDWGDTLRRLQSDYQKPCSRPLLPWRRRTQVFPSLITRGTKWG